MLGLFHFQQCVAASFSDKIKASSPEGFFFPPPLSLKFNCVVVQAPYFYDFA